MLILYVQYLFDKISQIMYNTGTMNNILRTIIRFAIILIFLVLLVFLSITLFKLIPIGINQLATSSLSLTNLASDNATTTDNRINQPVATTTGGLNGVITQNLGDIVISEPKPIVSTTNTSNTTKTPTKVVYVEKPVYYPQATTYYPTYVTPRLTGLKNIKSTLIAVGIIDRYSGQFVATNSFNTNDTVSVKYKISNDQDTATGPFSMRVEMPALYSNDQVKYINNINIPGRSSYDVEARFDGINTYNNAVVRIYTDTNNQVSETNESDNNLFVTLNNVLGGNNNNNCTYYNNCYPYNDCTYYNTNCNNNYGTANLTIASVQTGKFINGIFYAQNNFNYGDIITIKLRVRNTGGSFTNTWSTRTTYYDNNGTGNFREKVTTGERYLGANEETTLTYSIENINRGNTTFNINIDSNNNIYETNEGDNSTSVGVFVN